MTNNVTKRKDSPSPPPWYIFLLSSWRVSSEVWLSCESNYCFCSVFCSHYLRSLVGGDIESKPAVSSAASFCGTPGSWRFLCLLSAILLSLQTANKDGAGAGWLEGNITVSKWGWVSDLGYHFIRISQLPGFTQALQWSQCDWAYYDEEPGEWQH